MTLKSSALSCVGAVLAKYFRAAPGGKRGLARIDRLKGHMLKDVGLAREKEALKHWQDLL